MTDPYATGPPGLDLARLAAHLDRVAPGLRAGRLRATLLPGGRSNLTYTLTDGVARWVLRRPPLGHVLATAHDMGREYRVLRALAPTVVPVPEVLLHCVDASVIGSQFYLMRYVVGRVYREPADLAELGPRGVRAVTLSLVDILADLHTLPPAEVGLTDFGRPTGFNARQVRRWRGQLEASRSRDLPGAEELYRRLAAGVPVESGASIVHGDFRLDNALIGGDGSVRAVLDWEMSTLGDPLSDLALMLVYAGRVDVPGQPDGDELVARYERRTGHPVGDLGWYLALAAFKLAVILEGVHYRYLRGQTVGAGFELVGDRVPALIAQGLAVVGEI